MEESPCGPSPPSESQGPPGLSSRALWHIWCHTPPRPCAILADPRVTATHSAPPAPGDPRLRQGGLSVRRLRQRRVPSGVPTLHGEARHGVVLRCCRLTPTARLADLVGGDRPPHPVWHPGSQPALCITRLHTNPAALEGGAGGPNLTRKNPAASRRGWGSGEGAKREPKRGSGLLRHTNGALDSPGGRAACSVPPITAVGGAARGDQPISALQHASF